MAAVLNNETSNQAPVQFGGNRGNNDSWKAQAFVNIYLPGVNGGSRRKVGALPLKDARPFEKKIIERLQSGGEEALQAFINAIEFDFQMADGAPITDIGF